MDARHSQSGTDLSDLSPGASTPALDDVSARLRAALEMLVVKGRQALAEYARLDSGRWPLFLPAAIGAGAGIYFWLKTEPTFWMAPLIIAALLIASATLRWPILKGLILVAVGFAAADIRTAIVDAPMLERELSPRLVTGRVVSLGEGAKGRRIVLDVETIDTLTPKQTPERIRLTWRGKDFAAAPGDVVRLRAGLSPPPAPVAPGAFDFARYLFFQRIGAVGYAVSPPEIIPDENTTRGVRLAARIEAVRLGLFKRINEAAPSEGGAIIAAVVTGKREAISDSARNALRDSGLAHLLAISGLHMGLATGLIFFVVRGGLAFWERAALRAPIKKIAAVAALGGGLFYLILSGGGWSARRAFIMTAIIFIAIIFDRRGLSLRNVAIAATLILITTPEALLHPGFQMSFAAVTALIAAYEWVGRRADPDRSFSLPAKVKRYAIGVAATDTIAALATAPYALYHFNRTAIYSLPANIVAMPIMAFLIMPFAVAGLILTPVGLDRWAWQVAAAGMDSVLYVARTVSNQPGAVTLTGQWPASALLVLTIGGIWGAVMTARWRWIALAALPISAILIAAAPPADIYVTRKGDNVGVIMHDENGQSLMAVADRRKSRFDAGAWQENAGLDMARKTVAMKNIGACDQDGCVVTIKGARTLAVSRRPDDLGYDCMQADIVVALYPVRARMEVSCAAVLVHRRMIWNGGAHALWLKDNTIVVRSVNESRGVRPWTGSTSRPASVTSTR